MHVELAIDALGMGACGAFRYLKVSGDNGNSASFRKEDEHLAFARGQAAVAGHVGATFLKRTLLRRGGLFLGRSGFAVRRRFALFFRSRA